MGEEIIKVKPCPFCGGKVDVKSRYIKGVANRKHYWIECTQCRASQCKDGYRTIGKAVARWNNRVKGE